MSKFNVVLYNRLTIFKVSGIVAAGYWSVKCFQFFMFLTFSETKRHLHFEGFQSLVNLQHVGLIL